MLQRTWDATCIGAPGWQIVAPEPRAAGPERLRARRPAESGDDPGGRAVWVPHVATLGLLSGMAAIQSWVDGAVVG